MLLRVLMLKLFSRLLPHPLRFSSPVTSAPGVDKPRPSVNAWRRLLTARNSRSELPVRHLFAIQRMPRGTVLHPYDYCYYCVRCRWAFLVDGRGGVVPVDDQRQPLLDAEAAYRRDTFARGPCGAHWASTAVIDGGRKLTDQEPPGSSRRASLTLVNPRGSVVRAVQ